MQVIYSHFFPSILQSEYHIFGWQNVNKIGKLIKSKLVNIKTLTSAAIMQAHSFQCLIYPKKERQLFYKYIGHSEDINECRYQAPATVMELTNIGRHLVNMDSKILLLFFFNLKRLLNTLQLQLRQELYSMRIAKVNGKIIQNTTKTYMISILHNVKVSREKASPTQQYLH